MNVPELIVEDERWRASLPDAETLLRRCYDAARALEPKVGGEVAVLLCDDATMRRLNREFRGKDAATNVLSFRGAEALGDLALGYEICAREAAAARVSFRDHAAHLLVHGLLHLAGLDHEAEADAARMEALEIAILGALGIANPYKDEEKG